MSKSTTPLVRELFRGGVSLADFFWSFVDVRSENDCWEWKGKKKLSGYGQFAIGDRFLRAHRIALELSGIELKDSDVVMHHCDNRSCCNPSHLKAGTQLENMLDMRSKGRGVDPPVMCGSDNPSARLSIEDVQYIRNSGLSGVELAKRFDMAQSTISAIKNRKLWNHV